MIAVAGLDMAIWDALAKAAGMPLAVLLGGSSAGAGLQQQRAVADRRRARWPGKPANLSPKAVSPGLKLGSGATGSPTISPRSARFATRAGDDIKLMVDFNQGLSLGDALHRCHALDDQGLYWFEEPIAYDNLPGYAQLARELRTPVQLGENFYGPRDMYKAVRAGAGDYVMPDLMRIGGVPAGCAPPRSRRRPASRFRRICIRRFRRI